MVLLSSIVSAGVALDSPIHYDWTFVEEFFSDFAESYHAKEVLTPMR